MPVTALKTPMMRPRRSGGASARVHTSPRMKSGLMATPMRKRTGYQAMSFCSRPTRTSRNAADNAQIVARPLAPIRRTAAGTKKAEAIRPSGVIAADRPISAGVMPWRCIMKVNSG